MNRFSSTISFLAISILAIAQHPNFIKYDYLAISHKFDNYKTPPIIDALYLHNGDTIPYVYGPDSTHLGYAILKSKRRGKANIRIYHPDYQPLVLDSVGPTALYMFGKNEKYYMDNGMQKSLIHDNKYLAIRVIYTSAENKKKIVRNICKKYDLEIGYSYADTIEKLEKNNMHNEMLFGCIGGELSCIYYLQNTNGSIFEQRDKRYKKLRAESDILWMGVPQEYVEYITSDIEIEFQAEVDSAQRAVLIKKYKLKPNGVNQRSSYTYPVRDTYRFKTDTLLPDEKLMRNLMKDNKILRASPIKITYVVCG